MENNYIQARPGGSSNAHTRARGLVTGLSIASTSACLRIERGGVDVEAEEVHLGGGEPHLLGGVVVHTQRGHGGDGQLAPKGPDLVVVGEVRAHADV
eukprot:284975-Prorocentrum_minimum.AAC.2